VTLRPRLIALAMAIGSAHGLRQGHGATLAAASPQTTKPPMPSAASASATSVRALLESARRQSGDGDAAGALESLRAARALAPNSEEVLSAFAQAALAARTLVPAIVTLDSLTRICPTVAQYHYLLGAALIEAGDMPAAANSLQRANRLEAERPPTLLALGRALNGRKQYTDARSALLESLELAPDQIDAVAALAEAEAGTGDLRQAEEHARRVLARAPAHPTANLVMGIVRMAQERYADARDALEKAAVAADPAASAAHYELSLAYARLGDEASSQKHVELYRQNLRETEDRIKALRTLTTGEKPR
jgi:tetratricopeptide (TPR) repeat protein